MTTSQQSIPAPGTVENAAAARPWRQTTWIAGVFVLLIGIGMVAAHLRHKASDPWRSPVLLELKAQLLTEPGNEELKQQIRELDLGLRERYFHLLSLKATGVYLLFGGALVFLYAGNRVRLLGKHLPQPQPDPQAAARLVRQAGRSRNAIAACGVLTLATFVVLGFTRTQTPLADPDLGTRLFGENSPTPAPIYAVSSADLMANWPRFRGYGGSGVAAAGPSLAVAPVVVWQAPSPAIGFNSPLVWKGHVFFTGGDARTREVFCLDGASGELRWRQLVDVPAAAMVEDAPEIPDMTGYAASTAATDGERVYAIFASGELAAFTLDGQQVWAKHLGTFDNAYGHAASLALWQDRLVVQLDQGYEDSRKSKVIVLDGRTGEMTWQKARQVGASWSTPITLEAAGKSQVITLGLPWVIAYSAPDGTELWRARLLEGEITPSPVFANDLLFIVDPGMYQLVALRPDGSGDVTRTHELWRVDGDMPDITSPVSNGELVFTLSSSGSLTCFDVAQGEMVWNESVEAEGEFQASPSLVGNILFLVSADGDLIAVDVGREYRELWRMHLEDEFHASPAFANARMYLRGNNNIWCLESVPLTISTE